jgi:hypothetical protein
VRAGGQLSLSLYGIECLSLYDVCDHPFDIAVGPRAQISDTVATFGNDHVRLIERFVQRRASVRALRARPGR